MRKKAIVPAAMLVALTLQAAAQDLPVLGQGNLSCEEWLERRTAGESPEAATMTAWVLGYITAFNEHESVAQRDVSAGQKTPELTAWFDDYCRRSPTTTIHAASAAFVRDLHLKPRP